MTAAVIPIRSALAAPAQRLGAWAAAAGLVGVLLSGPLAVALVSATRPQPPWQSAEVFARSYHPVQVLPYLGGIVLVSALVLLIASLHALAGERHRAPTGGALAFTATFAALIFLNYVLQAAFLPALARSYEEAYAPLIASLTLANPKSLAWSLEMWGWACFGVATWLAAPALGTASGVQRAAAWAFTLNGPISILGAVATTLRPGWEMTPAGYTAFAAWNVLLTAMLVLALVALRTEPA